MSASTDASERNERAAFSHSQYVYLVGASALLGSSFYLVHVAIEHLHPLLVTWMRVSIGAVVLCAWPHERSAVDRRDQVRLWCAAVLWMALPMTLVPLAQKHVSSGLAGMVNGATPLFAAAVAAIMARRLPLRMHVAGLVLGGIGLVMLSVPSWSGGNGVTAFGLLLVAALSYGAASNVAVPLLDRYGAIGVLRQMLVVASALTLPGALVGLSRSTYGASALIATFVLGVMGTGLGFFLLFRLTELVGASRGSIASYLKAPIAFALGVILLSEGVQPLEVLGCATLVLGAWLSTRPAVLQWRAPYWRRHRILVVRRHGVAQSRQRAARETRRRED